MRGRSASFGGDTVASRAKGRGEGNGDLDSAVQDVASVMPCRRVVTSLLLVVADASHNRQVTSFGGRCLCRVLTVVILSLGLGDETVSFLITGKRKKTRHGLQNGTTVGTAKYSLRAGFLLEGLPATAL